MGRNIKGMRKKFFIKWKSIAEKKNVSPIEAAVLAEQILRCGQKYIPPRFCSGMQEKWCKRRISGAMDRTGLRALV